MAGTYESIATNTLSSSSASVSFSSIPSTYTDLVVVANLIHSSFEVFSVRFNDDTSNNYGWVTLQGNGSSVSSGVTYPNGAMNIGLRSDVMGLNVFNIMNYANTNINKTVIARANASSNQVRFNVGTWQSNNAITKITIFTSPDFLTGSTFTLYGIKAA